LGLEAAREYAEKVADDASLSPPTKIFLTYMEGFERAAKEYESIVKNLESEIYRLQEFRIQSLEDKLRIASDALSWYAQTDDGLTSPHDKAGLHIKAKAALIHMGAEGDSDEAT
jgi:hypothetical protein